MQELYSKDTARPEICILACSPRAHGNSDTVAHTFAQAVQDECCVLKYATPNIKILYLREYAIIPCIGCNACFTLKKCIFAEKDDVDYLYSCMMNATHIFLASPIFFYHLPAIAKAFMDRAQQFYVHRSENSVNSLNYVAKPSSQQVSVALVAARKQGENLFKGTLWSLHYFFDVFRIEIANPLLFKGFDEKDEFAQNALACAQVQEHAKSIVQNIYEQSSVKH